MLDKNNKAGSELLEYGGYGMVGFLEQLFSVILQEENAPRQCRRLYC